MVMIGKVLSLDGENANAVVTRKSMCGGDCDRCRSLCAPTKRVVIAANKADAQVDDMVVLDVSDVQMLSVAVMLYVVPVVAMVIALVIMHIFSVNQLISIAASFGVLVVVFIPFLFYDRHLKKSGKYEINITKVLTKHDELLT